MIWQNPLAWIGAAAVALPIAVHLLGRGHARVYRFPTLRFVRASRLLPARRTRIHDPALLVVRILMLLAAAAALAQPLWSRGAGVDAQRRIARAVVLDTSTSMRGARASAAATAARAARGADEATIIAARSVPAAITSAAEWLERQSGRRELVVVSDFARGVMDRTALARVPAATGVRLMRIPSLRASGDTNVDLRGIRGDSVSVSHVSVANDHVSADWTLMSGAPRSDVRFLGSQADLAGAEIALRAARAVGLPLANSTHAIAIVLPGYANAASLARQLPREPWMIDVLSRLPDNVRAAQIDSGNRATLLLFCDAPAASLRCTSIVAAALRANSAAFPTAELEPVLIPDADLRAWQRAPGAGTEVRRPGDWFTGPTDARWLWALVLMLLALETWMRRERARVERSSDLANNDLAA